MKTTHYLLTLSLAIILLFGCATISPKFQIKDIQGLRGAYLDIYRSYQLAYEIEGRSDIATVKKKDLHRLYDEARAQVNAFLESIKIQASTYAVDISPKAYSDEAACKALARFLSEARTSLGVMQQSIQYVSLAGKIIDIVVRLHNSAQKEAYNRFVKLIDENKMKEWQSAVKQIEES